MKLVRVQYTVKQDYASKNKENIAKVMDDLKKINNKGIMYSSYALEDGKTFMHLAIFKDEEANKVLSELGSFKQFVAELKASEPEAPPKPENLSLAGSSFDFFK